MATTRQEGGVILTACYDELERRKGLFMSVGGAKSLADYNSRANGNAVRPLCAVLDEGTVLFKGDGKLTDKATDLVLLGRSFGLWLILAAQDFKVKATASEIRNQLTTRVQFHAQDPTQARILLGHADAQGLGVGRAIVRLKGRESDIQLQAPVVSRDEIDGLLAGQQGAQRGAPVEDLDVMAKDDKAQAVINAYNETGSISGAARVFGTPGGNNFTKAKSILQNAGLL